jgi:hypothetical protein
MLRIKQIVSDCMLDEYEFTKEKIAELIDFVDANKKKLRELSLRTVIKAADLMRTFKGDKWKRVAEVSLMR